MLLFIAALLAPGFSRAEISFQPSPTTGFNGINLPSLFNEFINGAKNINNEINNQVGKYIGAAPAQNPVGLTKISQFDLTRFLRGILENSFLSGIYLILIKIVKSVGNFFVWILNAISELIKQGLLILR